VQLKDSLLREPNPTTQLWRYMSLDKLKHLLSTSSIYFPRANNFNDPWEGIHSIKNMKKAEALRKFIADLTKVEDLFSKNSDISVRNFAYISCWSAGDESALLWDARWVGKNSIAVKSTASQLTAALDQERDYYIAHIDYVAKLDILEEQNLLRALFLKRKPFRHEEEVRAALFDSSGDSSISVKVDLPNMINSIVVSPNADSVFFKEVLEEARKYLPRTYKVVKSQVYENLWKGF